MSVKLTKVIANFQTQLTAKLSVGGTSINIQSATDKKGVALPAGKYGFSINLGKSDEEHIVADLSGTALTNIESVSYQGVKTTGAAKEHRVGAVVKLTDFINFKVVVDMLSGAESFDGSNPLSYDVEPTITDRKQFATAGYVQDVAAGAIGTANPTAAGTTRMTHDQGSKPRAMSTLVREQNTPDMTLLVGAFKHSELDKNISFAGGNSAAFINPGLAGDLAIALNPSNGETFTLTINGTACVFTFVSSIGSTIGNVLIGASAAETRAHLTAFINSPGTTNGDQVAFTGARLTALGLVSATDDLSLNMFVKAISATVTTLTGAEAMAGAGNIWTANTTKNRIDLLVLQTSDSTLQIRRGTEAVSPVAPTPTSGDIVLVHVYCKIGMTSIKDITDGTNGYIVAWLPLSIYGPSLSAIIYAADTGASDAYAVSISPIPTAYYNGMVINFKANTVNTGAATLNVNGLGAKTIKRAYNEDLLDQDIKAGQLVSVIYDGTNFQLLSTPNNSKVTAPYQMLTRKTSVYPGPVSLAKDGNNVLYIGVTAQNSAYNAITIYRLAKDTGTGLFYVTHTVTWSPGNSNGAFNMAVVGEYLYISRNQTNGMQRYAKADLTGGTGISVSGGSMYQYNKCLIADPSDSNNIYVYSATTGYRLEKYSISGTTLTFVSYITVSPSVGLNGGAGCWADASYFYIYDASGAAVKKIDRVTGAMTDLTDAANFIEFSFFRVNNSINSPFCLIRLGSEIILVSNNSDTYTDTFWNMVITRRTNANY